MKIEMIAKTTVAGVITDGKQYSVEHFTDSLYVLTGDDGNYAVIKEHFESGLLHSAKQDAKTADHLAKKERERVRDNVLNAPFVGGYGWRIQREGDITFADIKSNNFQPNAYVDTLNELREILRVPKGENIVTHAKVVRALADALIGLQK
ncbi:putative GntR-family transcriptional regulator [Vibrio phage Vc1]|uniref:GntR-family transcriptional regulator n=1 Tax=Vibrio phage Vc1 TaxID=1480731 RepID=A0A9X9SEF8_9CAUD|nr:putative GntR-family transcriptional regulator [Vibrio virus 2019VC1]